MSSVAPPATQRHAHRSTGGAASETVGLAPIFLSGVSESVRLSFANETNLEHMLLVLVSSAKAAWPPLSIPDHAFVAFIAERFGEPEDARSALLKLRADDLLLACACAASQASALAVFKKRFDPEIARAVRRFGPCPESIDDIQQIVCEKLFVGGPDVVPKILQYRGRGSLLNWIRVVVVRVVQNLHRGCGCRPAVETDSVMAFGNAVSGVPDPELAYLKLRFGDALREAIREAMASLTADERIILRYRYRDGLAVEAIARIYQAHRTTMTRRIANVRTKLRAQTHAVLAASLGGSISDVSSILRLVSSQLDVNLASVQLWGEDW